MAGKQPKKKTGLTWCIQKRFSFQNSRMIEGNKFICGLYWEKWKNERLQLLKSKNFDLWFMSKSFTDSKVTFLMKCLQAGVTCGKILNCDDLWCLQEMQQVAPPLTGIHTPNKGGSSVFAFGHRNVVQENVPFPSLLPKSKLSGMVIEQILRQPLICGMGPNLRVTALPTFVDYFDWIPFPHTL